MPNEVNLILAKMLIKEKMKMQKKYSISYWRGVMESYIAIYGGRSTVRSVLVARKVRKIKQGY